MHKVVVALTIVVLATGCTGRHDPVATVGTGDDNQVVDA